MDVNEFLFGGQGHGLTGEAAWAAYEALGGDGLTANPGGWARCSCPAHRSRSGNSLVFKIDESSGSGRLIVFDHAGCSPREVLEAAGIDVTGIGGLDGLTVAEWLDRTSRRPASFGGFDDPAEPVTGRRAEEAIAYFAAKRRFDVDVLRRCGVTAVQYPHKSQRDRDLEVRARFPFTVDGCLVGAWDRAIADVGPGGRRWIMSGSIPVPYGWDTLAVARDTGHVFVVEGPTDAVALRHALPGAAILGAGVGRSMWRGWWGPEFACLTVWLFADNDRGGQMTREAARAAVSSHALEVIDVAVPRRYGDVDDWRVAAGDGFGVEVIDAIQRAVRPEWSRR